MNTMEDNEKNTDLKKAHAQNEEVADFEKAMSATGFGLFNLFLFLIVIPMAFASAFETSTMSFILPIAECDLKLSLRDKGLLNASTYAGMIVSAIFWGYLADTQGRKKVLVICLLGDAVCVFLSSLSQNVATLLVFKFLGGAMASGPSAVVYTYITEVHIDKHRSRVMMGVGMIMAASGIVLPLLAWGIFPRDWDFILFNSLRVHSWQIFLLVSGIPSLISGFLIMLLPETPKFLMSQGRNAEALRAFQKIYAINTRKPRDTYPIKKLIEEVPSRDANANEVIYTIEANKSNQHLNKIKRPHRSLSQSVHDGMAQMKPLFRKPLLGRALHVYALQFCILLGLNTIRLWLPQLFASIGEYEALETTPQGSANLCNILEYSVNKTATLLNDYEEKCANRQTVSIDMYINNIIAALIMLVGYAFGGTIVRAIGAKQLMVGGLLVSGCLGMSLYWSVNSMSTLIISSLYLTVSSISTMSLMGAIVALFPTSLRSLIIATALLFGRAGALTGNMLFPIFIEWGCIPPFLLVGSMMMCASALSCLLPSTKRAQFT